MNAVEIIARKQAGQELTSVEINEFVQGCADGSLPDYQLAAWLMAVYFQGMTFQETTCLIKSMVASGQKIDLTFLPGRKVDKHSTGGVGDKVSLIVAPLVASLGVPVPMISGRGLGHTGGTLDKLESIPGFQTSLTAREFVRQMGEIGCALIGQTEQLVPADRKMYALRDVTSTVKSPALIAGSILSKKVAEGADALLLDVKVGSGAVYSNGESARELAKLLVSLGKLIGLEVRALLTDMEQPLGRAVGNWLEVRECLQVLQGDTRVDDLYELCLVESALMLMLGEKAEDYPQARRMAEKAMGSGRAFEKFLEIARRQKADVRFLENPDLYVRPKHEMTVKAEKSGYLSRLDARLIGQAAIYLGAGRQRRDEQLDYAAGILLHHKCSDRVEKEAPLATLYSCSQDKLQTALPLLQAAVEISDGAPPRRSLILCQIMDQGEQPWV